jgi:hypothetical protein
MPDLFRCPKCAIALDVPAEFRGKVIRCLECQATLQAPGLDGGELRLITRGRFAPKIFVPVAALLLLGAMGMIVNGYFAVQFARDPAAVAIYAESTIAQMTALNALVTDKAKKDEPPVPDAERRKQLEAYARENAGTMTKTMALFAGVSAVSLAGGIAYAVGRWRWLAALGCVAAIANLNHGCCFPGAVAGVWGLFALISNEGLRHFGSPSTPA